MPKEKAKRFASDGYARWLKEDKDFLARALNDTAYLSRVAKEYLSAVCPPNRVRAIPGRLTSLLRGKFGLNLGTYYGDNGTSTFALPDIRRRITVGCPSEAHPTTFGTEQVPVGSVDIPAHARTMLAPVPEPEFRTSEMRRHRVVETWLRED